MVSYEMVENKAENKDELFPYSQPYFKPSKMKPADFFRMIL